MILSTAESAEGEAWCEEGVL